MSVRRVSSLIALNLAIDMHLAIGTTPSHVALLELSLAD
jgi:hypothetical protein